MGRPFPSTCRVQVKTINQFGTKTGVESASEINGPEVRRGMEKFKRDEWGPASFWMKRARANCVFIGLQFVMTSF